jgi:hypothetical protein
MFIYNVIIETYHNINDNEYIIETSKGRYNIKDYTFVIREANTQNNNIIQLDTLNILYKVTDLPSESKPRETSNKYKISFGNISVDIPDLTSSFKLPIPRHINSYKLLKPSGNSITKYEENQYIGTDGEYSDHWYHTFDSTNNKSFTIKITDYVTLNNGNILIKAFEVRISGGDAITIYTQNITNTEKYSSIGYYIQYHTFCQF